MFQESPPATLKHNHHHELIGYCGHWLVFTQDHHHELMDIAGIGFYTRPMTSCSSCALNFIQSSGSSFKSKADVDVRGGSFSSGRLLVHLVRFALGRTKAGDAVGLGCSPVGNQPSGTDDGFAKIYSFQWILDRPSCLCVFRRHQIPSLTRSSTSMANIRF